MTNVNPGSTSAPLLMSSQYGNHSRPLMVRYYSSRSGLYTDEPLVIDSWDHKFGVAKGSHHWKTGGMDSFIVLVVAAILWAAAGFVYYARTRQFILAVETLNQTWINVPNLGSLLSLVGTVLGVLWASALAIVGTRWLFVALGDPNSKVTIGHWRAVAGRSDLRQARWWSTMSYGGFSVAILVSWSLSAVLSGALLPTLSPVVETVAASYFRIAGATPLENGIMRSCYDPVIAHFPSCPAATPGIDMASTMTKAISQVKPYVSAGLTQVTIRGAAAQYSLPWAWQQIPSSRLQFSGNHLWSEGCFPTVVPIATCVVVLDPPEIRKEGSLIIYSDACTPMGGLELPGDIQVNVNGCTNGKGGYDLYYSLFGSFLAGGTGSQVATQVRCSVEIEEKEMGLKFVAGANAIELEQPCGNPGAILNETEMIPITTSLLYVLRETADPTGITPLSSYIVTSILDNRVEYIEDMLVAGMTSASQALYLAGLPTTEGGGSNLSDENANRSRTHVNVAYRAYAWGRGRKGLAYFAALCVLATIAIFIGVLSLFLKRLRFDPGDFVQTLFVALGSRLEPPDNTCTGKTPNKLNSTSLRLAPAEQSTRIQFTHNPRVAKMGTPDEKLKYGN